MPVLFFSTPPSALNVRGCSGRDPFRDRALLIDIQWINRRKLKKGERKLTSALFYFGLTFTQRNQLIDGFQDYLDTKKSDGSYKEAFRPDVLVANTRVIAYGHNLTRANKMVIMEPDYSAQVEAQECAREHRLGQWRPVRVYRMVCKDVPQEKATLDQQKMTMGFTSDMYKVNVGDQGEIIEISSGDESDVAA